MKPWRPGDILSGMHSPDPWEWPVEQVEAVKGPIPKPGGFIADDPFLWLSKYRTIEARP